LTQISSDEIRGLALQQLHGLPTGQCTGQRARQTMQLLQRKTPDFIAPDLCQPNSQGLNSVGFKIWSVIQQHVCDSHINNVEELKHQRLSEVLSVLQ